MKQTYWLTALLSLTVLFTATAQKNAGWKTFDTAEFYIEHPKEWTVDETGIMGTRFILLMPFDPAKSAFQNNLSLVRQELPGENVDLQASMDASLEQMKSLITDLQVVSQKSVNTASGSGYVLQYTGKMGALALQWEQRSWIKNKKIYVLTLTLPQNEAENAKKVCGSAMDSFWIKG